MNIEEQLKQEYAKACFHIGEFTYRVKMDQESIDQLTSTAKEINQKMAELRKEKKDE